MAESVTTAPPNALFVISDASGGIVPEFVANKPVLWTDTMITVNCLPDVDGETRITLGPSAEVGLPNSPGFDGFIKTPTKSVLVHTVEGEEILVATVPLLETRIRIWTNRIDAPDEIVVGWGE